jgi:hypothetical protein
MMGHAPARHYLDDEIDNLRRLLSDLDRIRAGTGPTADELAGAPVLDNWALTVRLTSCLAGEVRGHPLLGDRRLISTSEIFAIDPRGFWARTYSRFYALGLSSEQRGDGAHG